jgi:hypothetical protein
VVSVSELEADACCEVNHAEHTNFVEKTENWDRWGIFLSSLCAIHCLVTPILLLALPVLGGYFENQMVHIIMALFVVPVGAFAFWSGYKHHKKMYLLVLGFVGLSLVGGAPLVHDFFHIELMREDLMTIFGSTILIGAHLLNRRACQCDDHSH